MSSTNASNPPANPKPAPTDGSASKAYQPAAIEPAILKKWDESGAFHADPARVLSGEKKPYCILIPPPNVTGALHLGHALNNTLQDTLIRAHRMMGFETLWIVGTDHAGIATQAVVERRLKKEQNKTRKDFTRDEFIAQVQAWKDEYEARITGQLKSMGCSCDFARQRFTMDPICARAVREAFFRLFKDGLIYRGKRLVNWDTVLQTAVADDECYEEEIETHFWYLKYPLQNPVRMSDGTMADSVTVATTRPETYLGDTAVALNPKDPRAAALVGKYVVLPLVGRVIPIVADSYVVLPESMAATEEEKNDPKAKFATGFLKVTPAHDQNDAELGLRHNLAAINMMSPDGKVSDQYGWTDTGEAKHFVGLSMAEARKRIVEEFKQRGLLAETRAYRQSVKRSERSKAIIEPYLSDQWYVCVTDDRLAGSANRALVADQRSSTGILPVRDASGSRHGQDARGTSGTGDGSMRFYPARYAKTYEQWHDNIRDWCISRQLWWGHRIPVWTWYVLDRDESTPTGSDNSFLSPTQVSAVLHDLASAAGVADAISILPPQSGEPGTWLCICCRTPAAEDFVAKIQTFVRGDNSTLAGLERVLGIKLPPSITPQIAEGLFLSDDGSPMAQDPDVLDTWFSSALWPLSTLGWPDPAQSPQTKDLLPAFNPTTVLSTAREIITLWVSRMVMFNRYFTGDGQGRGQIPFHDVFIHAVVQDGDGRKMSKTDGNGVDPLDIIESHGADAMRFTLAQMTTQTQDVRMPVKLDPRGGGKNTSDKFDAGRNFVNKLWNASRFAMAILDRNKAPSSHPSTLPPLHSATGLSLPDRWLLSRLARATRACENSLKNYEFSDYCQTLYQLLWWDYCDWYLEAVKPTVDQSPQTRAVLRTGLDVILRLLHPVAPFITEHIFEQLKAHPIAPIDGITLHSADLLCTSSWPTISDSLIDEPAEKQFEELRELINAIRNIRSEHQVLPKRRVTLHCADAVAKRLVAAAPGLVENLAGLETITDAKPAPGVPVVAFRAAGEEMHLTNLADAIDAGAEKDRLIKQRDSLVKSEAALNGRLSNPGYVDKAPPKLVEESKVQLAKIRAEIAAIEDKLKTL